MDKIEEDTESSNSELIKRYRFLFTLPKSRMMSVLIGISGYVAFPLSYLIRFKPFVFEIVAVAFILGVTGIIVLYIINKTIKKSKILDLRRLSISIAFINIICIISFLVTSYVLPFNRIMAVYILILFVQAAISLIIFVPLLSGNFSKSSMIVILLILPQVVTTLSQTHISFSSDTIAACISGILVIFFAFISLYKINKFSLNKFNTSTFELLTSFLNSWINNDGTSLEDFLEKNSEEKNTITWLIHLETESKKRLAMIIPYIHPGPFHPIGSYNLVKELSDFFKSRGYEHCFILHGPVDHTFNLCSRQAVNEYLNQLILDKIESKHLTASLPNSKLLDGIRLTMLTLNDKQVAYLSSSESGLEDYPPDFVYELSLRGVLDKIIVVDSHNSIGPTPSKEVVNRIINELVNDRTRRTEEVKDIKVAFTTITKEELGNEEDVGYNGIGVLLIQMYNHLYALVSADANNALSSVRKTILKNLQVYNINLIDLTTSDTHFNATKVKNPRGYFLLGEKTPQERLANTITNVCLDLRRSLEPVRSSIKVWNNYVKVIKPSIYSDFNDIIQKSINMLKVVSLVIFSSVIIGLLGVLLM